MPPTTLTALRTVIKYIKKEYKPCPDFCHDCMNCHVTYALSVLEEIMSAVYTEKWLNEDIKKINKKMIKGIKK
jgi:hypothetical protein